MKKETIKGDRTSLYSTKPPMDRIRLLGEAVESIRDYAIFLLDPDGYILTWNDGAERLKGYTEKEILGKHFSTFYTEADLERNYPYQELKEAKKVGRYEDEGWRVRKDGTRFWASVIITKLADTKLADKNGRLLGFSKVTRDLTDRKATEERLRQSEERFRLLIEGVKDYAIFGLDPEGCVTSWNEGARRILGYESSEIMGNSFQVFFDPQDVSAGRCAYELEEARLTGRFEDEGWRIRKDGTRLWANVVVTAIRNNGNRLIGFSKVVRDLTDKKRAEDKLARAYSELERRVNERTSDLARANDALKKREGQLEEALRTRDDFLSIASHELKTPITSLKIQMQLMKQRLKSASADASERTLSSLDVSLRQVARLTQLVEDLLDVARAQSKKLSFHFESVDLVELTREVTLRLADELSNAGCSIELSSDENLKGHFDRFRVDQVLVNLLTNAMKYAPGTKIHIEVRAERSRAKLIVSDEGPGIPANKHESIFERFERATNSRNISGLGLGLFISKQIVEGHHGSIRVESEPGMGAKFIVELPLNLLPVKTARTIV